MFVWPMFHRMQRISLNTMTLNVESPKVYSKGGVPVTVKGVAQVKIQGKDLASLRAASEMFLDKTEDEIKDIAKATLDGHQRSMIASMDIETIYKDRKAFSKNVHQSAQSDLIDMGLTLVSYTVQDITDDEGYLDALGQTQTVKVRTEARTDIAKSKALADKQNIDTDMAKREKEIEFEQAAAIKQAEFELALAQYTKDQFANKAKSDKAGDLQVATINKLIASEQLKTKLLEKTKETELMTSMRDLKQLELANTVKSKADFECEREKALARAFEQRTVAEARAEAERIEKMAAAKADVIRLQKETDAAVLLQRADAFKEYGNAAKMQMVLAILPKLTSEIAGPIANCNKITSVSQDGSVGFSRVSGEVLEVVESILGSVVNMTQVSQRDDSGGRSGSTSIGAGGSGMSSASASKGLFDKRY